MAIAASITRPVSKFLPKAQGAVQSGIVGIGAYSVARFLDGMLGGRLQSIGFALPIIGSLSVLDLVMILSFKATMRNWKNVGAAFAGDRIFNLKSGIPGINIPMSGPSASSVSSSTGQQGGGF